ncbi:hypothetical protein JCM18918_11 [Cutibacterium acnes JCM 18918]|nr:hypothetical protein JCM18918_11 [Cutibacterium acnes JCM 18918]
MTVLHPTPPSVEMGTRDDPVRNPTVVKKRRWRRRRLPGRADDCAPQDLRPRRELDRCV